MSAYKSPFWSRRADKGYVLVIAEKPKAAERIARALDPYASKRLYAKRIPYWVLRFNGERFIVCPAAGHLFGLWTREEGFPVFSFEWVPLWIAERGAGHSKLFYMAIKSLARSARIFVNACDYDIEGSVIGFMIIRFLGDVKRAYRVKYSSLTATEIRKAFMNLKPLDYDMIEAGLARHELDWLWGINVSRALMHSVRKVAGRRVVLSAGRVQSPTLMEVVRRDAMVKLHVPLPLYLVECIVKKGAWKERVRVGVFERRGDAEECYSNIARNNVVVVGVQSDRLKVLPRPTPFNLPDLQLEASRHFGFSPYYTQQLAEQLYLEGLISYPRTNSQKLPRDLDYRAILSRLAQNLEYRDAVLDVLKRGELRPNNGAKDDPAHPAIYPTGEGARGLRGSLRKLYDIIVRRFLATLHQDAYIVERRVRISFPCGIVREISGVKVVRRGWLSIYDRYYGLRERELPLFEKGEVLEASCSVRRVLSEPPRPYTKMELVRWMESVNIGTESTRARIVELLIKRGYLTSRQKFIYSTELGSTVAYILSKHFPKLVSVDLTRKFELMLNEIREGKRSRNEILLKAREVLARELEDYEARHSIKAGMLLSYAAGIMVPEVKCIICGRWAERREKGKPLCDIHAAALKRMLAAYREWVKRGENIDFKDYLMQLVASKESGIAIKDVAKAVLRGFLSP